MIQRIAILGTGLIGASTGLALRAHGFEGTIAGWDPNPQQLHTALSRGAVTVIADDPETAAAESDLILLAGPVFTILEGLDRLAPILRPGQLVTDVGSVKGAICARARDKYNGPGQPGFLPGHPMSGKEVGGAENADAHLFNGAVWLFTPCPQANNELSSRPDPERAQRVEGEAEGPASPTNVILSEASQASSRKPVLSAIEGNPDDSSTTTTASGFQNQNSAAAPLAGAWRAWVARFGCRVIDLDPGRHDVLCAWISHLPQFVSTALSALLEDEFAANADLLPIGGRALREMTRLGASPFSMWRDIAHTNADAIARSLHALEQRLAHIRENLKTPELRDEFERANKFRIHTPTASGPASSPSVPSGSTKLSS